MVSESINPSFEMQIILIFSALCFAVNAQFSEAGKQAIVDVHNELRSSIAKGTYIAKDDKKEPASNMLKLKWNDTLAASAQDYADKCPSGHSWANGIGENMFWLWSTAPPDGFDVLGKSASGAWASEFTKYGWPSNTFDGALYNSGIGHATQMAWAWTGQIGCGVTNCPKENDEYKSMVVCQYKNQGNIMGGLVYKEGETCSECPENTTCEQSTGLCA